MSGISSLLGQDEAEAIRAQATSLIELLQLELESAKGEMELVSVDMLRESPTAYTDIPIIGMEFTPQEIRSQVILSARQIETVATRVRDGSVGPYLSEDQKEALDLVVQDAKDLAVFADQFDTEPVAAAHAGLSQDHLDSHVGASKELLNSLESKIVTVEGGRIPVVEPAEKEAKTAGIIIGVGLLAILGLVAFGEI